MTRPALRLFTEALGIPGRTISGVHELGPVVAALLFASRAGSAITAEIGLMKATEQLSAMEMMAVNPIARVVAPRLLGGCFPCPCSPPCFRPWACSEDIWSESRPLV